MKKIIAFVLLASPLFASAQAVVDINTAATKLTNIENLIIGLLISIAILYIIYSVVRYLIVGSSSEEERAKGQSAILYGVIGLFVILSIWGLVAILRNSFRTQDQIPTSEINRTTTLPQPGVVPN